MTYSFRSALESELATNYTSIVRMITFFLPHLIKLGLKNTITLEVMRIVLTTGFFAVGVELPCAYMKEHAKSLLIIVVPTMAFGWFVVAGMYIFSQLIFTR
ncbi:hypothetical protein EV702DRAFT_44765 [Suillus placidus]|uniref:Uncharacterized protein n=1 Tax=Suillus placidus TaxID=48579 RepID=A0A9P7D5I2_9AGAM|nr:hypothetical protein EV702DRAFT_44765 [Suillus placidus]